MSDERCGTCRFWDADGGSETGECHRHAPSAIAVPHDSPANVAHGALWPDTYVGDWCGEWQAKRTPLPVVEENPVLGTSILDALGNSRGIRAVWQGMRRAAGDPEDFDCTVADLVRMSDDEVVSLPGVGKVALLDALRALAKHGLKLKGGE
jgi:hypothetical protein